MLIDPLLTRWARGALDRCKQHDYLKGFKGMVMKLKIPVVLISLLLFSYCASNDPYWIRSEHLRAEANALFPSPYDAFGKAQSYTHADGNTFLYRMFEPKSEAGETYPLVVFLHGGGGAGLDNEMQFKDLILPATVWALPEHQQMNPSFVLVPQAPEWTGWLHPKIPAIKGMVDSVIAHNSIDTNRIYISGLSMGGMGTWAMIQEYPDFFAAAVPICGAGDMNELDEIMNRNLPIWAFHGVQDPVVKIDAEMDWFDDSTEIFTGQRALINELISRGMEPTPKYTWYPDIEHDSWNGAYSDPELLEWLFAQRKP